MSVENQGFLNNIIIFNISLTNKNKLWLDQSIIIYYDEFSVHY